MFLARRPSIRSLKVNAQDVPQPVEILTDDQIRAAWLQSLTPPQRAKFRRLAEAWRSFKYEVTHAISAGDIEPVLASPRSSLDTRAVEPWTTEEYGLAPSAVCPTYRCGCPKVEGEKCCPACARARQNARRARRAPLTLDDCRLQPSHSCGHPRVPGTRCCRPCQLQRNRTRRAT
jgi:hypothetical protein